MLRLPVLAPDLSQILSGGLSRDQPAQQVVYDRLVDLEIRDVMANVLVARVTHHLQLGTIRADDDSVSVNPMHRRGRGLEEIRKLCFALAQRRLRLSLPGERCGGPIGSLLGGTRGLPRLCRLSVYLTRRFQRRSRRCLGLQGRFFSLQSKARVLLRLLHGTQALDVDVPCDCNHQRGGRDEQQLTRTIHVDSRYIVWVMDAVDGAHNLLRELGITPKFQ